MFFNKNKDIENKLIEEKMGSLRILGAQDASPRSKQLNTAFEKLNEAGQDEAIRQVDILTKVPEYQKNDGSSSGHVELNAAHTRTDAAATEENKQHDDDIMNDDDF